MNLGEAFAAAWRALRAHGLRATLAMLGIVFGVAAVIAMLAIGKGAERQALEALERLGARNVLVRAKKLDDTRLAEIRKRSPGLGPRDAEAIVEAVPGALRAVPRVEITPWAVVAAGGRSTAKAVGVAPEHAALFHLRLAEGRFLDRLDERTHAAVCVLGDEVRRELFGYGPAVGELVKVNDLWLEVIGVLAAEGASGASFEGVALGSSAGEILLPASTVRRKLERPALAAAWDELVVEVGAASSPREAAAAIGGLLDHLHAGADDVELVVPEALLEQSRRTRRLFTLVMSSIAGIALLVGGIGITNIMLASVLERTREIGVRRAVGATRADVRRQFLIEGFTICGAGGALGIAVGFALARIVAAAAGWPTIVTAGSVLVATGVAVAVGLASGFYPAERAAALDPIEALRWE